MKAPLPLAALLVLAPLVLAGGATHGVAIADRAFDPQVLVIGAGDTVVWTNRDEVPHTVSDVLGGFDSGTLGFGASYARTFDAPGPVVYQCNLHARMYGLLVVAP